MRRGSNSEHPASLLLRLSDRVFELVNCATARRTCYLSEWHCRSCRSSAIPASGTAFAEMACCVYEAPGGLHRDAVALGCGRRGRPGPHGSAPTGNAGAALEIA